MSPGAYVRIFGLGERGAVSFQPDSLEYSVRLGECKSTDKAQMRRFANA